MPWSPKEIMCTTNKPRMPWSPKEIMCTTNKPRILWSAKEILCTLSMPLWSTPDCLKRAWSKSSQSGSRFLRFAIPCHIQQMLTACTPTGLGKNCSIFAKYTKDFQNPQFFTGNFKEHGALRDAHGAGGKWLESPLHQFFFLTANIVTVTRPTG